MDNNIEIKKVDASYLVTVMFMKGEMLIAIKEAINLIGKNSLVPMNMWYWIDEKANASCIEFMCKGGK